jgi:hypothetical protein
MRRAVRSPGQSAVLVALILPFVVGFALLVVEVAERWLEVAMVEDALQQTTRSAVQLLDYRALARGDGGLRAGADCRDVAWDADPRCRALLDAARRVLIANLGELRGLAEDPAAVAGQVRWTVLPNGGTCRYSAPAAPPVSAPTPLICAEVRPAMRGIVGWGTYRPLVIAADTIDPLR